MDTDTTDLKSTADSLADVTSDLVDTSEATEKEHLETMLRGTLPCLEQAVATTMRSPREDLDTDVAKVLFRTRVGLRSWMRLRRAGT